MDTDAYRIEERPYTVTGGEIILTDAGMLDAINHQVDPGSGLSGTMEIQYDPAGMTGARYSLKNADGSTYSMDLTAPTSAQFQVRAQRLYLVFSGIPDANEVPVTALGWR